MSNASSVNLFSDPLTWRTFPEGMIFGSIIVAGQILLDSVLDFAFGHEATFSRIPASGHHLDVLGAKDWGFIAFNRAITALFSYHMLSFCCTAPKIVWGGAQTMSPANTLLAYVLFFLAYDFCYSLFHRFLHTTAVYPYIHKHHHRQGAPSRGNVDACNTHPVEYVSGEYLHLLILWGLPCHVHIWTVAAIVVSMGLLASLNHTRYDVKVHIPLLSPFLEYAVAAHDMHHHFVKANYGQYTMIWDHIMGTSRTKSFAREQAAERAAAAAAATASASTASGAAAGAAAGVKVD